MEAIDYINTAIIAELSKESEERSTSEYMTISEIVRRGKSALMGLGTQASYVDDDVVIGILDVLRDFHALEVIETPHASTRYAVKVYDLRSTIQEIQKPFDSELERCLALYRDLGRNWLRESLNNALTGIVPGNITLESRGRRIDQWEPLPVNRPDESIDVVIEKFDDLIESVRGDNGYVANYPAEQIETLSRLDAGIKYLRDASIFTYTAVDAFIIVPIGKIMARFNSDTIIGAAATLAWSVVKEWFKDHGVKLLDQITGPPGG